LSVQRGHRFDQQKGSTKVDDVQRYVPDCDLPVPALLPDGRVLSTRDLRACT
jgi:hypothetical protein